VQHTYRCLAQTVRKHALLQKARSRAAAQVVHPGCEVIDRRPGKQLPCFGKARLWNKGVTDQPHARALLSNNAETNQVVEHRSMMEVARYATGERLERRLGTCEGNQVGPVKAQPARGNLIRGTGLAPARALGRVVGSDLLGGLAKRADILAMQARQQAERRVGPLPAQPYQFLLGLREKHRLERSSKPCVSDSRANQPGDQRLENGKHLCQHRLLRIRGVSRARCVGG